MSGVRSSWTRRRPWIQLLIYFHGKGDRFRTEAHRGKGTVKVERGWRATATGHRKVRARDRAEPGRVLPRGSTANSPAAPGLWVSAPRNCCSCSVGGDLPHGPSRWPRPTDSQGSSENPSPRTESSASFFCSLSNHVDRMAGFSLSAAAQDTGAQGTCVILQGMTSINFPRVE